MDQNQSNSSSDIPDLSVLLDPPPTNGAPTDSATSTPLSPPMNPVNTEPSPVTAAPTISDTTPPTMPADPTPPIGEVSTPPSVPDGNGSPIEPPPPVPEAPPAPPKKGFGVGKIIGALVVILLVGSMGIGGYIVTRPDQQVGDFRGQASTACDDIGGLNQACRAPENCSTQPICDNNLVCTNGTCQAPQQNSCVDSGWCVVYNCGTQCDYAGPNLNNGECRNGTRSVVRCDQAQALLGSNCGQVDFAADEAGNICPGDGGNGGAVMLQNCTGTCNPPRTTNPPSGPSPTNNAEPAQCENLKIYDLQGNRLRQEQLRLLKPGDRIVIAVKYDGNATKARIRINGTNWAEINGKNDKNEFIYNYTLPPNISRFKIEAEVRVNGRWI